MPRLTEKLDKGLADAPDSSTLEPGQLSHVSNAVYKGSDQALHRARGRTVFGTATATASDVNGLRDCQFDLSAGHYLIAQISGAVPAYVSAFMGDTGTFGVLTAGITAGSAIERTQWNNQFYFFNGTSAQLVGTSATTALPNSNKVLYLSATAASSTLQVRQHGMLPVNATPTVTTAAGTFALTVTGYYEYWTTEVAKLTADNSGFELESTFDATPATVPVLFTTTVPTIQMPPARNGITTHWRVYRSPKKEAATDKAFPDGFMIGEQAIATAGSLATFSDTQVASNTGAKFATTYGASPVFGDFSNPTAMGATDGVFSTANVLTVAGIAVPVKQGLYGFVFGGFAGSIVGIEVIVRAYVSSGAGPIQLSVSLGNRSTVDGRFTRLIIPGVPPGIVTYRSITKSGLITSTSSGALTVLTLGGSTDRWWAPDQQGFTDGDFDGSFMVVLSPSHPGVPGTFQIAVDSVTVNVYYGGSTESTIPFPTVVYTFGDIVAEVGKNGPPPSSRTGTMYQGSLVVNDESSPGLIRYSAPELPDYFPSTYYLSFETDDNDVVQAIKVVNSRLVILLSRSAWRANYLPSERDASFDRGKAIEPISESYGCLNPMCACVFSMDSSTQLMAWVSQKGIHVTDGFSFSTLTNDIEWRNILSLTSTSQGIALISDAEERELLFYYRNDALGNDSYKCLHLSYDTSHVLSEQKLKISGKVNMRNYNATAASARADLKSAWNVPRNSGDTGIYLGYGSATAAGGGMVYRETGTTIPAEDPKMSFITRRIYAAGESNEWTANELYAYVGSNTSTAGIDMTLLTVKTDDDAGEVTKGTSTVAFAGRKHGKYQFRQIVEGLRVSANATGNPNNDIAIEHLIIEAEGFGSEDSGL